MSYFKRCLAKFYDYSLLFFILYLIGNKLDIVQPRVLILSLVLSIPVLWVFLETLFLKRFSTTPGKALLGIRLIEKPSFKKAFTLALLPFSKAKKQSFIYKTGGSARCILSLVLSIAFASTSIIADHLHPKSKALVSHVEGYEDWSALAGDLFTAYFPSKAEANESVIALPDDYDDLQVTEHKAIFEDTEYSIAYATIPQSFLKYSHSMILKHTMKAMANEMEDTSIVTRGYSEHGPHKAVDYVLNSKGKTITGRMLIVKDRMYKLEVISEPSTEIENQVNLFRDAFIPK